MDLVVSVRAEQIRALYRQSPLLLWTNAAIAAMVAATLWWTASRPLLLAWIALMIAIAIARSALMRRFDRVNPRNHELESWDRHFALGAMVAGAAWGVGAVVFFDAKSAVSQILLTFAIGGMTAAAAGTWASRPPAFWGYFSCALGPLLVRTLAVADTPHIAMGGMLAAYTAGMGRVVQTNYLTLTRAFRLNLENSELLSRLSLSQAELEETNRTLERRVLQRTAELERQAEALRDAQRLEVVGRLAGGIAHDFNNLLTIVLTNIDILEETQNFDAAGGAAVEETLGAARRGADLIRQLLAFSRRQRVEPRVLDVNRVVAGMDRLVRRLVGERIYTGLNLHSEPLRVVADPTQLEQVLVNLVSNARDAMPEGGKLSILTELAQSVPGAPELSGKFACLRVEDEGAGMDAETLKHAFDPFFSTKGAAHGSGLGLATVHGIVQQLGGRVEVSSELGWGSKFAVYLPITERVETPHLLAASPSARPSLAATILVAEDEPTLRSVIRRSLVRLGHTVIVAEDGERALRAAKEHPQPIDLLVTDVVMPNLGGAEVARQLMEARPNLSVLFISGYSWGEALPESNLATGIAYLQKPFDTRALETRVSELLAAKPGFDETRRGA
ncbi:MAG TPA: ATP-binding protein [Polyangiaceae bacterium]|jgi:signal transduction histidine kinase/ActR/RegA family two-component response regulator|nr:ATP-binding protein [Polyangiaceae bacterium]